MDYPRSTICVLVTLLFFSCYEKSSWKAFEIIQNRNKTYYHFEINSDTIQSLFLFDHKLSFNYNSDESTIFCIDKEIKSTTHVNNAKNRFIQGNHIASILASHALGHLNFNEIPSDTISSFIPENKTIIHSWKTTDKQNGYSIYCENDLIGDDTTKNCLWIKDISDQTPNFDHFEEIDRDSFVQLCDELQPEFNQLIDYLKNQDIKTNANFLLVDFFHYYCLPCIKSIPLLNQIDDREDIKVLGIYPGLKDTTELNRYRSSYKPTYQLLSDPNQFKHEDKYISSYPYYVIIDLRTYTVDTLWSGYSPLLIDKVISRVE